MSPKQVLHLIPMQWNEKLQPRGAAWHVGQAEWTYLIPVLHQALARQDGPVVLPSWPRAEAQHEDFRAYWETAIYMMVKLLGWADPQHGMKWFYDRGFDHGGDPRLRLLSEVWNSEGQLNLLAAWLWRAGSTLHLGGDSHNAEVPVSESWRLGFLDRFPQPDVGHRSRYSWGPYHGGTNALHLGHSLSGHIEVQPQGILVDKSSKKASLLLEKMAGWSEILEASAGHLTNTDGSDWMVDVAVKPVGWLGCFRRSSITGRWYLGRHDTHLAGNVIS